MSRIRGSGRSRTYRRCCRCREKHLVRGVGRGTRWAARFPGGVVRVPRALLQPCNRTASQPSITQSILRIVNVRRGVEARMPKPFDEPCERKSLTSARLLRETRNTKRKRAHQESSTSETTSVSSRGPLGSPRRWRAICVQFGLCSSWNAEREQKFVSKKHGRRRKVTAAYCGGRSCGRLKRSKACQQASPFLARSSAVDAPTPVR